VKKPRHRKKGKNACDRVGQGHSTEGANRPKKCDVGKYNDGQGTLRRTVVGKNRVETLSGPTSENPGRYMKKPGQPEGGKVEKGPNMGKKTEKIPGKKKLDAEKKEAKPADKQNRQGRNGDSTAKKRPSKTEKKKRRTHRRSGKAGSSPYAGGTEITMQPGKPKGRNPMNRGFRKAKRRKEFRGAKT